MSVAEFLKRGLLAGLLAGLLSALFGFVVAEPTLDTAIAAEEQTSGGHGHGDEATATGDGHGGDAEATPFTRNEQKAGLLVAGSAAGAALGALVGLAALVFARRGRLGANPWRACLALAAGAFVALHFLPALRYPPNPPGVGDPDTITRRSLLWVAAVVIGFATVALAAIARRHTREVRGAGQPGADLAALAVVVAGIAALFALPSGAETGAVDAGLLWDFRLRALATEAVLWAGIGVIFGVLTERAMRRRDAQSVDARPVTAPR